MDDVLAEVAALKAERTTILTTLGTLADVVDMSDQGRSVNASATRASLTQRLQAIAERLGVLQPFEYVDVRR